MDRFDRNLDLRHLDHSESYHRARAASARRRDEATSRTWRPAPEPCAPGGIDGLDLNGVEDLDLAMFNSLSGLVTVVFNANDGTAPGRAAAVQTSARS